MEELPYKNDESVREKSNEQKKENKTIQKHLKDATDWSCGPNTN